MNKQLISESLKVNSTGGLIVNAFNRFKTAYNLYIPLIINNNTIEII
jgi:hypothetical protein